MLGELGLEGLDLCVVDLGHELLVLRGLLRLAQLLVRKDIGGRVLKVLGHRASRRAQRVLDRGGQLIRPRVIRRGAAVVGRL